MNIAQLVQLTLDGCNTFTLYGGYGIKDGKQVRFATGRLIEETRNDKGQCSTCKVKYKDGSTLKYRRRPDNQFTLEASK